LYLTIVHQHFDGDAYFPQWNVNHWQEVVREDHHADEKNPYDYSFLELQRIGMSNNI